MFFGKGENFVIGEIKHFAMSSCLYKSFQGQLIFRIILLSMNVFPYKKLVVIGTTSSGKSTLAEQLAQKIGGDFIELDALNWGPNWTPAGDELLRARAEEATRSPGWVVAGNYSITRPVTWPRAEAIIWLDYSFWVIFWRL